MATHKGGCFAVAQVFQSFCVTLLTVSVGKGIFFPCLIDRHPKEPQRDKDTHTELLWTGIMKMQSQKKSLLQLFHFPARNFSMQM